MSNLFKRAAVFTDIHWGLKSNSVQHNIDCTNFVDWFIEQAKKENCETCFFLGDWNHNRAAINLQTLQFGLRALERLNDSFEQVYFIPGNHDLYYRDKRDVHGVEWARHLSRVTIVNDWFTEGDVTIAPWIVGDEWRRLGSMTGKYMFGHFELPHFYMNSFVEMPDHGELNSKHLTGFEHVFSGHFHKRQTKSNVTYIGNAFPHNFADAGDDDRGMMILEWGTEPKYKSWPNAPKFRVHRLSDVLDNPNKLLLPDSYVKINLDINISFEEANFIREKLIPEHNLRELTLVPVKIEVIDGNVDISNIHLEGIDSIVQKQIEELEDGAYNKQLLLEIYKNL
jgi:DNA repair exonuclease SbcCD nuclease subunit